MVVPLYPSIFFACLLSLPLYDYFAEDVFFIDKINNWLNKKSSSSRIERVKLLLRENPYKLFVAISIWWSPLHAHIFFRNNERRCRASGFRNLAEGSFYCAVFWGIIADLVVSLYKLGIYLLHRLF
jgi:hypothetical protein